MSLCYYLARSRLMNKVPSGLGIIRESDSVSHGMVDNIDEIGSVYNQNIDIDEISVATPFMALENKRYFKQSNLDPTEITGVDVLKGKHDRNQADTIGNIWRFLVRGIIALRMDPINRLRFARSLQIFLPFLSSYEAYLLGELIEDLDSDVKSSKELLARCFANRNVSRILVKTFASKFDVFWHLSTQIKFSRAFDFLGKLPLLGFFAFPATENFPSSKSFSFNTIVRSIKPGAWIIRVLTSNLEGSIVLDPKEPAQNGGTATSGFELANRNAKGTFFGRREVNKHRIELRLPTDESIVRSFSSSPAETMLNNGIEHVLRCLVKHWRNLLNEENGNFAHQRMELLNPFETLRVHLPVVLTVLMNSRGRNVYDTEEVAPLMKTMQELSWMKAMEESEDIHIDVENSRSKVNALCSYAKRAIVDQLIPSEDPVGDVETITPIVDNICAGLISRSQPLAQWIRLIRLSIGELEREAEQLLPLLNDVHDGITIGYRVLEGVDWLTANDNHLKAEIVSHIKAQKRCGTVTRALDKLASKEKRTLIESIRRRRASLPLSRMLLSRAVSLIKREKQRDSVDQRIDLLSKGPEVEEVERFHWYWITIEETDRLYCAESKSGRFLDLRDVETGQLKTVDQRFERLKIRKYHPIAAAIVRAQKVFMTIEMDYLKRFSYEAFMEFGSPSSVTEETTMRTSLLQLLMVSQLQSYQIDDARRNILSEVKLSGQRRKKGNTKPQNVLIVGGGPSGMMCAILALHNVLLSGGELSIHQKRDAFQDGSSVFERSQIVRLDARIISLLRYHLGTVFEDTFVPLEGETKAYLGNTLPEQGFVEINIKRLEEILDRELVSLKSRELLAYYQNSEIIVDPETLKMAKKGGQLKRGEVIVDASGTKLIVKDFVYRDRRVDPATLRIGQAYRISEDGGSELFPYRFSHIDLHGWLHFNNLCVQCKPFSVRQQDLPPIYEMIEGIESIEGVKSPTDVELVEIGKGSAADSHTVSSINFKSHRNEVFEIDVSDKHVVLASGKPTAPRAKKNETPLQRSTRMNYDKNYFKVTTAEPYIVLCIEGAKVSIGMHRTGNRRFETGWLDDLRSFSDENTRLIGDFTKSLRLISIVEQCSKKLTESPEWREHFTVASQLPGIVTELQEAFKNLCSTGFKRERLQIRMFELGETYYIGMELPREYDSWKTKVFRDAKDVQKLLDKLWIEAATDVLALGDVFNPGAKVVIPQIHTIDSSSTTPMKLGDLQVYDAFSLAGSVYHVDRHDRENGFSVRLRDGGDSFWVPNGTVGIAPSADPKRNPGHKAVLTESTDSQIFDTFEILSVGSKSCLIRNEAGYLAEMSNDVKVIRLSDLSRGPDGKTSKVAVASFPVAHTVCMKTMFRRDESEFMNVYIGDAQASPHFMRYSGLTGACINVVSFNNFIGALFTDSTDSSTRGKATGRDPYQQFSAETSWSTVEVVHRGTGEGFGEDSFLRPGFDYRSLVKFLRAQLEEQDASSIAECILSDSWKKKLGTSLIPRGLETDNEFLESLHSELMAVVAAEFGVHVNHEEWSRFLDHRVESSAEPSNHMVPRLLCLLGSIISHAEYLARDNSRISSELFKQPKSVDYIADEFAVEAQNFATGLTMSTSLAAFALALRLLHEPSAKIASTIIGLLSIWISFGTITNVSRYRNRNEEARTLFFDEQLLQVEKDVAGQKPAGDRRMHQNDSSNLNPYWKELKRLRKEFLYEAKYYDEPQESIKSFEAAFRTIHADDRVTLKAFRKRLITEFIPKTFHINSYLQETLVRMYRVVHQNILFQEAEGGKLIAKEIEKMLPILRKDLKPSLQRGPIRYGFVRKELQWYQHPLVVGIRRFLRIPSREQLITRKVYKLLKGRSETEVPALRRSHMATRQLYYATIESQSACRIILSAAVVLLSGFLFSVFRFISFFWPENPETGEPEEYWVRLLVDITAWAVVGTVLGAIVAVSHFTSKMGHLMFLFWQIFNHSVSRGSNSKLKPEARVILSTTLWQILLTFIRLLANVLACVALPWSAYQSSTGFKPFAGLPADFPLWCAAASLGLMIIAAVLFRFVELFIRYNLDPKLGKAIFNLFKEELDDIYESQLEGLLQAHLVVKRTKYARRTTAETRALIAAANETIQHDDPSIEEQAWELTARHFLSSEKYRFDTVFAADRFGSIFQYLHLHGRKWYTPSQVEM